MSAKSSPFLIGVKSWTYVVCSLLNWYCLFQLLQSLHKKLLNNVWLTLKFIFDFVPFFCGRQFIKVIPNWAVLQTGLCASYYETKKVQSISIVLTTWLITFVAPDRFNFSNSSIAAEEKKYNLRKRLSSKIQISFSLNEMLSL